ncbi:uncharacterized protein TM35_000531380 [Trypanosoma theileri]|uniref:Mucin-associated surface protein (MASP) n=1 Tax=Trypanosoma theileri TaxID=67003 RepID=A0A1X0NGP6_9TRYP|nr:uncharacterized protein TM35_000531380 [Trypanosoma theileri]ORC83954.1 hypothetical protein TM35_000531380 [Trypanosoma theileri]
MQVRRVLYFLALIMSVASVCVAAEESELEEVAQHIPAPGFGVGECPPGKTGTPCKSKPGVAEAARPECVDASGNNSCPTTTTINTEDNCGDGSKPPCQPPAHKGQKTTTTKIPEHNDKGPSVDLGPGGVAGDAAGAPPGTGVAPAAGHDASTSSTEEENHDKNPVQGEADPAAPAPAKETGGLNAGDGDAASSEKGTAGGSATNAESTAQQPSSSTNTVTESVGSSDPSTEKESTSVESGSPSTEEGKVGSTETTTTTTTLLPETVNNKKGDADSSSSISSSVWMRTAAPLLIVVVLFSATVY